MNNPRTPGTGITGASVSLASDDNSLLHEPGSHCNEQVVRRAATLDRIADFELAFGRHRAAERLAWRAEAMRAGGAA